MSAEYPPKILMHFFRWFCDPELVRFVEGDLIELYQYNTRTKKRWRANWIFFWEIMKLLRPSIIKNFEGTQRLNYFGMFKHNLIITFRGFLRHKTVFGINLVGLIVSLTCVLFSALWINDELEKDQFHADSNRIFQVYTKFLSPEGTNVWKGISGLIEPEIESQIPQTEIAAVSTDVHEYTLSVKNDGFKVDGRFADEDYLKILNYPLWKGDASALSDPSNILITRSLAKKIFGREDVMNESIDWHFWTNTKTFRVAGILEDVEVTTSEPFEFILPWTYYHDQLISYKDWGNFYGRVLVKLNDVDQKELAEIKINEILQANLSNDQIQLFLTNYSDQYLYGNYENGEQAGGRIDYVKLTIIVTMFILLIACINFINLSTAFSSLKTKEIGVKKSFGATKSNLAFQFFLESILLSTMAIVIALILVATLLEPFNQLAGKQLSLNLDPTFFGFIFLFIPAIGIIAGLYPAVHLSKLEVISALKPKLSGGKSHGAFGRQTLVFVQFTLSIMLIVGTLIVSEQMNFALNKNLGYDRDNLLYFLREGQLFEDDKAFIAELGKIPELSKVSKSGFSVGPDMQNRTMGVDWEGKEDDQQVSFWENNGDAKSVEILGLELVAGRDFSEELNSEENSVIFNETAIRMMGLEDPIGKTVEHYNGKKEIIGVVKDFTTESIHQPMEPAMFFYRPDRAHYIMVKIEKGMELRAVQKLELLYDEFNPGYPFEPKFVDQDYQAMYDSEMRVSKLSKLFAGFAILISCMGLFGLTIFQVKQKVKEVAIKKVLGCSSWNLTLKMTYEFTKSVVLALIVAIPLSYFLGKRWLENFADSIEISGWMLASAGLIAMIIAFATVSSLTRRAASANPVDSLRGE
ncbi:MAG: ABC transporter permease [Ekhidna sp.]